MPTDQQYVPRSGRGGGSDVRHAPASPDEQARYWVDGDLYPRLVLDVPNGQVLVGDGTVPPVPLAGGGGGGAPTNASYVTTATESGLSAERVLGTLIRDDVVANRGAFGTAGQLFGASDTLIGYLDTGSAWLAMFPVLDGTAKIASGVVPNLDFSKITTGTVPIGQGGTGQVSAAAARSSSGLNIEAVRTVADVPVTLAATDHMVIYTSLTATRAVTFPAANAVNAGHLIAVLDGTNNASPSVVLTCTRAGADLIDRGSSVSMSKGGGGRLFVSDGVSNWYTVAAHIGTNTARVTDGGTGATTLTGILKGNGTSAFTAVTAPAGALVGDSDTQTLTNKRITKRVETLTDAATVTASSDTADQGDLASVSQTTLFAAPSGTPTDAQEYIFRVTSAAQQSVSFTTGAGGFRGGDDITAPALPTVTTGGGKTDYWGVKWNAAASRWDLLAKSTGY